MGTRGDGGGTRRAWHAGPLVAAIAGATAVAAAAALTRRRRGAAPSPGGVAPASTASPRGRVSSTADPSLTATPPGGERASRTAERPPTTAPRVPTPGHPLADRPASGAPPSPPGPAADTALPGTVADSPSSEPAGDLLDTAAGRQGADGTATGGPASKGTSTGGTATDRTSTGGTATDRTSTGGTTTDRPSTGGTTTDRTSTGGTGGTATGDPAANGTSTGSTTADRTSTGGPISSRTRRLPGGRRTGLAAAIAAVALLLGGGAIVAGTGGDGAGDDRTATASTGGTVATTVTTLPPVTADNAFAAAAERITTAGSFSYSGTVSATDVSSVRPMFWLAVSSTVEGQVATASHRLHEVAVTSGGAAAETVAVGESVWGRRGPSVEALAELPFEPIPGLSGPRPGAGDPALVPPARGAALLPAWLAAATEPTDVGPDEHGRRRFQATIPAAALGEIERQQPAVDATVVLTLDPTGVPVRVEVTSSPSGPAMHLAYDIAGLGQPVTIEPPT